MKLKLNKLKLEKSDKFDRYNLVCEMVTAFTDEGKYIKHIKIDDQVLKILNQGSIRVPKWVNTIKLLRKDEGN